MTEQNDPKTPQPEELEELSDESLDEIIKESDPEFVRELAGIAKEKLSAVDIELRESDRLLYEERQLWRNGPRWQRALVLVFPLIVRLSLWRKQFWARSKSLFFKIIQFMKSGFRGMLTRMKEGVRNFFVGLKSKVGARLKGLKDSWGKLSFLRKLLLLALLATTSATIVLVVLIAQGKFKLGESKLFLMSFDEVGHQTIIGADEKFEPFYDNLRVGVNLLLLPKMVINLKASKSSGPNPMGAFEFFVEGMTKEVTIELKDREIEVRDRLMRKIEEFTFDQVDTAVGKQNLSAEIQKELNSLLTTGRVKKVLIKTAIVKP